VRNALDVGRARPMLCGMRRVSLAAVLAVAATVQAKPAPLTPAAPAVAGKPLRGPDAFAKIADPAERSRALFLEASRVLTHPRCINCHPAGDVPHQGMTVELHYPPAVRGPKSAGVVGVECTGCHQDHNLELARVPGAPKWQLAPLEMAWVGKSPRAICEQMQDPKRNGGRTLAQIVEHNAHDELVGWGWHPGADREPAPGTQELFGRLIAAWVETGAKCPPEEARP
jgi:hypothetical protein